jgi:hypothetical protein
MDKQTETIEWEHKVDLCSEPDPAEIIRERSKQLWELVNVNVVPDTNGWAFFWKRPLRHLEVPVEPDLTKE